MVLARSVRLLGQHKKPNATIVASVVNATSAALPPSVKHVGGWEGLKVPAFVQSASNLTVVFLIVGSVVGVLCLLGLAISLVTCALQQRQRRGYSSVLNEKNGVTNGVTNGNIVMESSACDLYSNGHAKDLPLLTLPGSAEQGRV